MILLPSQRRLNKFQQGGRAMAVQSFGKLLDAGTREIPFDNKMTGWGQIYSEPYDLEVQGHAGYGGANRYRNSKESTPGELKGFDSDERDALEMYNRAYNTYMTKSKERGAEYTGTQESINDQAKISEAEYAMSITNSVRKAYEARKYKNDYDRAAFLTTDGDGRDSIFVMDAQTGQFKWVPWTSALGTTYSINNVEYKKFIPQSLGAAEHVRQSNQSFSYFRDDGQNLEKAILLAANMNNVDDLVDKAFESAGIREIDGANVAVEVNGQIEQLGFEEFFASWIGPPKGTLTETEKTNWVGLLNAQNEIKSRVLSNTGLLNAYKNYAFTQLMNTGFDPKGLTSKQFNGEVSKIIDADLNARAQKYLTTRFSHKIKFLEDTEPTSVSTGKNKTPMTNFELDISTVEYKPFGGVLMAKYEEAKQKGENEAILTSPRAQINMGLILAYANHREGFAFTMNNNTWPSTMIDGSTEQNVILEIGVPLSQVSEGIGLSGGVIDAKQAFYYHYGVPSLKFPDGHMQPTWEVNILDAVYRDVFTSVNKTLLDKFRRENNIPPKGGVPEKDQYRLATMARGEAAVAMASTGAYKILKNKMDNMGAQLVMRDWISNGIVIEDDYYQEWLGGIEDADTKVSVGLSPTDFVEIDYKSAFKKSSMSLTDYEKLGGVDTIGPTHLYETRVIWPVEPAQDMLQVISGIEKLDIKEEQLEDYLAAIAYRAEIFNTGYSIEDLIMSRHSGEAKELIDNTINYGK